MDQSPAPWWKPFPLTLILTAAFLGGALADRHGWLPFLPGRSVPTDLGPEFDSLVETWHLIRDYYPDREAAEPAKMAQAGIDGMLAQLGDDGHTAFLTQKDAHDLDKAIEGSMEGIGARLTVKQQKPMVASVVPGSPAQNAGLQPGDVFLQVDGKDVGDRSPEQIATLVRGPAGTQVQLKLTRTGQTDPMELTITRAKIEVPQVSWAMLPGTAVAHVAIEEFGEKSHAQLRAALDDARKQGAKGMLLDLRGNPGGLRDQAVGAASEFLREGNVLIEQDARGAQTPVRVTPGGSVLDLPLVVLVDEGTVSAGEIFAAAMQDHERGTVVGAKTFGTGTILMTFKLPDGSAVNMAVAKWLTPKGRSLWHKGLTPDVEVTRGGLAVRPEDAVGLDAAALTQSKDAQLLKALELLKTKMAS